MNRSRLLQVLGGVVVLALALGGGWAATTLLQEEVAIAPGLEGCWRLDGSPRQVECASEQLREDADRATDGLRGAERDAALIEMVRATDMRAAEEPRLAAVCHPAMHDLGRAEGRAAARGREAPRFPGGASQLCTAGYVHGLAEGYLADAEAPDLAAVFPGLCHEEAARSGCTHGIGHALVREVDDGSAREVAAAAVERCTELPDDWPADCYDGVYMELAMRIRPEPVEVPEYVATCEAADDGDRELSCWGYLGLSFAANDVPVAEVPEWCAKAPLPSQFTCVEGYGRDLGVARVEQCRDGIERTSLVQRCIEGAMGLQVGSGHVEADEARESCTALDDDALVDYCRDAVERYERGRASVERS